MTLSTPTASGSGLAVWLSVLTSLLLIPGDPLSHHALSNRRLFFSCYSTSRTNDRPTDRQTDGRTDGRSDGRKRCFLLFFFEFRFSAASFIQGRETALLGWLNRTWVFSLFSFFPFLFFFQKFSYSGTGQAHDRKQPYIIWRNLSKHHLIFYPSHV